MKKMFEYATTYAKQSTWKDIALVKFCLCAIGMIIGVLLPDSARTYVLIIAGAVFLMTYIPLMSKLFKLIREEHKAKQKNTMNETVSFARFLQKYWWLIIGLGMLLIVPVSIFCFAFRETLDDTSAWASMIAGIATYLGSAFLGVLVFYNSWVQCELHKQLDDINVIFNTGFQKRDGYYTAFEKDEIEPTMQTCHLKTFDAKYKNEEFSFVKFEIINNNFYTPVIVSIEGIYFLNSNQKFEKCAQTQIYSNSLETKIIDNHSKVISYYGVPKEVLKTDYYKTNDWTNCVFVFKVQNTKGDIKYYVEDFWFAKSILGSPRILTEKQYLDNVKKFKVPMEVTHFNRQLSIKKSEKL